MAETYARLPASGVETIVLAFELSNYNPATGVEGVKKAVKNPALQKAITEVLQNQAKSQLLALKSASPTVAPKAGPPSGPGSSSSGSSASPGAMALPLGASSAQSIQDALKQLQLNPNYSLLVQDLKKLQNEFEKSVIGVWIDENKKTLIIIASGIAVAAATAMYFTKSGDTPADWATQLAKGQYPLFKLGKIEFGVGDPTFKPSTSTIGGAVSLDVKNWKFIKEAELDVTVTHSSAGMQNAGVTGKATVALPHDFSITGQGSIDPIAQIKGVRLGIDYDKDGIKVGVFADVTDTKGVVTPRGGFASSIKSGSMEFGLKGDISKAPNTQTATTATATFTYRF
jgi:hypothetical protein